MPGALTAALNIQTKNPSAANARIISINCSERTLCTAKESFPAPHTKLDHSATDCRLGANINFTRGFQKSFKTMGKEARRGKGT